MVDALEQLLDRLAEGLLNLLLGSPPAVLRRMVMQLRQDITQVLEIKQLLVSLQAGGDADATQTNF